MSGAVKLAVTGVQDQWLTGDPDFSYFLTTFKKHTKFALEQIETPLDGTIDFGNELRCIIPQNKGDLIKGMTVKFLLTDPDPGEGGLTYVPSLCTRLIDTADLYIGGQLIQRITGEYIYMHQQLTNTIDDAEQTLYFLNGHGSKVLDFTGDYTFFIDLPFYFNRVSSLSIPTTALSKQLVEVVIKLNPLESIINGVIPSSGVQAKIKNMSLDTEFVFVSDEERQYLQSMPLEYLMTQIQVSQVSFKPGEIKKTFMINFKNPVRQLFFIGKKGTEHVKIEHVTLDFNDMNVIDADYLFLTYEQPLLHHVNSPEDGYPFGLYSFADRPDLHTPSGQVNMSRIIHKRMTVTIEPSDVEVIVKIYASSYNILHIESGLAGLKF
tara:strand:+ start:43 stop:1179 length:1137 start_codon:yes stop_codon:yes gene_type:complete